MTEQLYDEMQVSALIGFKPATLRKRRWEGKGPQFLKVGRKVFYRKSDIEAFLASCVRRSTSDTGEALS